MTAHTNSRYGLTFVLAITMTAAIAVAGSVWAKSGGQQSAMASEEIRVDVATTDLLRAGGIDVQDGKISSSGRTAVDMQKRTLTYMLEGQPAAGTGPLATSRPRYWQVDGNLLTLTTKDDAGRPTSIGRWRKM